MNLHGTVSSGLGRAHVFMAQLHYQEQFRDILGQTAWPGTLNVTVKAEDLPGYIVRLLRATREAPQLVLGASPRAGVMLLRAAKVAANFEGRDYVLPDDVKSVFLPTLRHRVLLDPAEEIEGGTTDQVLARILDSVEVPR